MSFGVSEPTTGTASECRLDRLALQLYSHLNFRFFLFSYVQSIRGLLTLDMVLDIYCTGFEVFTIVKQFHLQEFSNKQI